MNRRLARTRRFFPACGQWSRAARIDAVLEAAHDRRVPRLVKILRANGRIDRYAVAAAVGIAGRVQRLMDIADEVDQEGEITERAPAVVVPIFQALGVLVDFGGDAVAAGTSRGDVGAPILQTDVDEVPGRGRMVFVAEFSIRQNRCGLHRGCEPAFAGRRTEDAGDVTRGGGSEIVRGDDRDDFVAVKAPGPRRDRA